VAEALSSADPKAAITVVGRSGGPEAEWVERAGLPFVGLPLRRPGDRGRVATARLLTRLPPAYLAARRLLRAAEPDVVLAAGGYVCLPVALAALGARRPVVLLEQNARPGRTVARLARHVHVVASAYRDTQQLLPGARVVWTGNPIRREVTDRLPSPLPPAATRLLVMGGSQGAHRLNCAVWAALAPLLGERPALTVTHLTGGADADTAQSQRAALGPGLRDRYHPRPATSQVGAAIVAADLVVMRAGGSSIAEVAACGRPMVLVPYPYAGAHQVANARPLVEAGAAEWLADAECTGRALLAAVAPIVDDPPRWTRMAEASRAWGRPDAAQAVVALLAGAMPPGPGP